ncbi:hypothetical protein DFJ74DRAFT_773371 [Hyaloraphidium curvatum]|nr:hypothetical protein DFJ74DRAFT_773371 [Hyaloraphidium curvatum]
MPSLPPAALALALAVLPVATLFGASLLQPGAAGPVVCSGATRETGRCVFRDALVSDGAVAYLDPDGAADALPPLLCSIANSPPEYTAECAVRAVRNRSEWEAMAAGAEVVETGVLLYRLNPHNLYHVLFEQLLPALTMAWDADPRSSARPPARTPPFALFVADAIGTGYLDERITAALLPGVRLVHRGPGRFRVGRLVAGTRAACTHWGHCVGPNGTKRTFEPPDAAFRVRQEILANLGVAEPPAVPAPRTHPRITLVQRKGTRGFAPHTLAAMNATLSLLGGRPPEVVDFASLDLPSQVRLAARTDLFVLVHGAAIAHAMFLPPLSVLLDVYPHAFRAQHHPLVPHLLASLAPAVPIGHFPFQVRGAAGQSTVLGPLRANCTCPDVMCEARSFWAAAWVAPDPVAFARRAAEAADAWRRAEFARPRTAEEHARYAAELDAAEGAGDPGAPPCWTDEDEKAKDALKGHG